MEETRHLHARVEGLRNGVVTLDAQLEAARQEREGLVARANQLESDFRMAEQEERDTAAGGERQRTRVAEVEAELGMLVSAVRPAPGDLQTNARTSRSGMRTNPMRSRTSSRGCATSWRGCKPT